MGKLTSSGHCQVCGGVFEKAVMTRHLSKSCLRSRSDAATPAHGKGKIARILNLTAEGCGLPEYWLHVEVRADTDLYALDKFFRKVWCECCGHMSAFRIEGKFYSSEPLEEYDDKGMDAELGQVLRPGLKFRYEYDFGSTTELALKVVGEREGSWPKMETVRLLARNDPPAITCGVCGQPATEVCPCCTHSAEGWLCSKCARQHRGCVDYLSPIVNSPRVGVCAYTGK